MKNAVYSGETVNYTVGATPVTSGDVVVIGELRGIAVTSGVEDDVIAVALEGVYEIPKLTTSGQVFAQGAKVYFDETAKKAVIDPTETFLGIAFADTVQADTVVQVMLPESGTNAYTPAAVVAAMGTNTITLSTSNTYTDAAVKAAVDAGLATVTTKVNAILTALKDAGLMTT
jgi:predicted RecA/RadA family phage recombinase